MTDYGRALSPILEYELLDSYGSAVTAFESTSFVIVTISTDIPQHCAGQHPYLSGPAGFDSSVVNEDGMMTFPGVEVYCNPLGNLTLKVVAQFGIEFGIEQDDEAELAIALLTKLQFRACHAGEYLKNGLCVECPQSTYSLSINSPQCKDCSNTEGVEHCHGNEIIVKSGYWRRHELSETVMPCTFNEQGCKGGNTTGLSSCFEGIRRTQCNFIEYYMLCRL